MPPPPIFQVEKWMDDHETTAKYQLAETCCASISLDQLAALSNMPISASSILDLSTPQTYGEIRGSKALRGNLAGLYSTKAPGIKADHVLITPGAISANFLSFYALLEAGDHVVCQWPTYQQLYTAPASLGCDVELWRPKHVDGRAWQWDVEQLKGMITAGKTKMVILNNPNNPTGSILTRTNLQAIVDLCREHSITIHSDEVYRPIFHSIGPMDPDFPSSLMSLTYDNIVVTGSLSKAYSLAGIRVGWAASRSLALVERLANARHYLNISVSMLDQQVASLATSQLCVHGLLARNIALAKANLAVLDGFVRENAASCEWVKPVAGTTAFIKFRREWKAIDDVEFCEKLQAETGVSFVPGSRCFGDGIDFRGFVRVGFVCEAEVLAAGLDAVSSFLRGETWRQITTV